MRDIVLVFQPFLLLNAHSFLPYAAPVEVKKEAPAPAAAPAAAAPSTSSGALGSVQGTAAGGKKLEAETVSADTLDFLKKYQ